MKDNVIMLYGWRALSIRLSSPTIIEKKKKPVLENNGNEAKEKSLRAQNLKAVYSQRESIIHLPLPQDSTINSRELQSAALPAAARENSLI